MKVAGMTAKTFNEPHAPRRGSLRNGNHGGDLSKVERCGAKTRNNCPCRAPAMDNGRCRMHGGPSTGPRTPEGLARSRRANWKTGEYSAESKANRRFLRLAWRVLDETGVFPRKKRCRARPLTVADLVFVHLYSTSEDRTEMSPSLKRSVEREDVASMTPIDFGGLPTPYAQKPAKRG
jgi:hypothetical protein